jgi:hypothetical protein
MEKMPTMQEWRRLHSEGKLTGPQTLFFQHPKPDEELYDLRDDPHEIKNLAASPDHQRVLRNMRAALDTWMKDTADQGAIPEEQLIQRMWPGHKQPVTATPTIESSPAESGEVRIKLACQTEGASIGYRIGSQRRWLLYARPTTLDSGTELTVKAVRIGYRPSPEVKKTLH